MNKYLEDLKKAKEAFKNQFDQMVKDFLVESNTPAVYFSGGTPHFNDGEPCEFFVMVDGWEFYEIQEALDNGVPWEEALEHGYDREITLLNSIPEKLAKEVISKEDNWTAKERDFYRMLEDRDVENVIASIFGNHGFIVVYYLNDNGELVKVEDSYGLGY